MALETTVVFRKTNELRPHEINATIYGDSYDQDLLDSIKSVGILTPIGVTSEGVIISGHRRHAAAMAIGMDIVPTLIMTFKDEMSEREAVVMTNRTREKNAEQIGNELRVLLEVEEDRARLRRLSTQNNNAASDAKAEVERVPPLTEETGKARDIAAAKLGISGKHGDKILSVLDAKDVLMDGTDKEKALAKELTDTLNTKSVTAAVKLLDEKAPEVKQKVAVVKFERKQAKAEVANGPTVEETEEGSGLFVFTVNNESYKPLFTEQTNESIEWAKWSFNPVTGCLHDCPYCYARAIANNGRMNATYPKGFLPTFHPGRLAAPKLTQVPMKRKDESGIRNVFVCSMADLFGEWVPQEWIDRVLDTCRQYSQWNYIFLTKNPARLVDQKWPRNAWVGTTVDEQKRVGPAMEAMAKLRESRYTPTATFLSCEPFLTELTFPDGALKNVDWVIVGAMKDGFQPQPEWVLKLQWQAYSCGCKIYDKPNLKTRFKQYPIAVLGEEEKQAGLI